MKQAQVDRLNDIIIMLVIVVGVVWIVWDFPINRQADIPPGQTNKIEDYEPGQIPRHFPIEVPIEKNAKILNSYNATSPDGKVQATQKFDSSKSMSTNFQLYKNYFAKNGWEIMIEETSQPSIHYLLARNQNGLMNVTIHAVTDSSHSRVDLSFLVTP